MSASQKILQRGDVALLDRECVPFRSHGSRGHRWSADHRLRKNPKKDGYGKRLPQSRSEVASEKTSEKTNQDKQRFRLLTVAAGSFTTMSTRQYTPELHYPQRGTLASLRQPWVSNMWTGLLASLCNHETSMRSGCCKLLQPGASH